MTTRLGFRPRPVDQNKELSIVRDESQLDTEDAFGSKDSGHLGSDSKEQVLLPVISLLSLLVRNMFLATNLALLIVVLLAGLCASSRWLTAVPAAVANQIQLSNLSAPLSLCAVAEASETTEYS
jgi:hypothetical protein